LDKLVSEFFGDHDEFCVKLSQKPATAHYMKTEADVFVCFPSNCTMHDLIQALSEIRESPLFVWIDGKNAATNGTDRSLQYWSSLCEIYKTIGNGIVVASPWSEPSPLPAARCLELHYARISEATVLMAASKKECDEFIREMREKPLGPTRFHAVLDHEVEDTSSATPASELIRDNFGQIRASIQSALRILLSQLADQMLSSIAEDASEQRAISLASRGSLHYVCGELDDAMRCFQEAHSILLKVRNTPFAASVLHNIAKIHEDQGQVQQALDLYERCLTMEDPMSKLSMKVSSGDLLNQKTPTHSTRNGSRPEIGFWRDSFTIPSPHDLGGAITAFNIACLLAVKGESERAEKLFEEALASSKSSSRRGESL
ncbi:MAG TPA: tetratricopeptide repeat protein, partial [Blastocatellia bacterium]|nr:tetratricopeptide repeat protein [Blastocatellia bacterium]